MKEADPHRYDDILYLPHHVSQTRPRMSMRERAAQFAPFAALTGYGAVIREAGRLTERKVELGDSEAEALERALRRLAGHAGSHPRIKVTYFLPDEKKEGGAYVTVTGRFKRIDEAARQLLLLDRTAIPIENLLRIEDAE